MITRIQVSIPDPTLTPTPVASPFQYECTQQCNYSSTISLWYGAEWRGEYEFCIFVSRSHDVYNQALIRLFNNFISIHISIYIHIHIFIRPYCYLYFTVDFSFLELIFYLNLFHQPDISQAHLRRLPLCRGGDLISRLFRFTSIHSSRCSGVCENEEMA